MKSRNWVLVLCVATMTLLVGCAGKNYDAMVPGVQANCAGIKSIQESRAIYISQVGEEAQLQPYTDKFLA